VTAKAFTTTCRKGEGLQQEEEEEEEEEEDHQH
jgi:hypothetical protein